MAAAKKVSASAKFQTNLHADRILILDFGAQYTQLIARRIRETGVYCEIYAHDVSDRAVEAFGAKGIILSGGPDTVTEDTTARAPQIVFELGLPVLGICYGMQTMSVQLGGRVETFGHREYGHAELNIENGCRLFDGVSATDSLNVWMSHGDRVIEIPEGFHKVASTNNAPFAAIADEARNFYGLQFHPEVTHTQAGEKLLARFAHTICGCGSAWQPAQIIENAIAEIQEKVGDDEVILGLSGGVDSSVAAALVHKAIGNKLTCIFVDNGLLRLNEGAQVMQMFARHLGLKIIKVDAEEKFLDALAGVDEPEQKRKIIGRVFIAIFQEQAEKLKNAKWLAQGTIYSDVIESAGTKTGKAKVIKSHHNVGGLPGDMHLKLLEPLREMFKDEVRSIGIELGLSKELVYRHPFPGPGLGVRILGEVKKEYADILREADAIFIDELRAADFYEKTSQAFSVFLPVKSVGVVGDNRAYEYVIALRAVETVDFMTANWAPLPYDLLAKISTRIINEVAKVSRVVYDISGKPPATIEWE
ncbi:MAG: glutamine-hydrolyzing GMP synthase [Arenicellales bacterium WSBS_2016_MAG_OTU3]